jgi:hypothetical protein
MLPSQIIKPLTLLLLANLVCMSNSHAVAYTCQRFGITYQVPFLDNDISGFDVIPSSCADLRKHFAKFGMEKRYWKGWGWEDYCNMDTFLNRTLRALDLLKISRNPQFGKVPLNMAYNNAKKWINHLRPGCVYDVSNSAAAVMIKPGRLVYLYENSFEQPITGLAGNIVHESRHAIKRHDGGLACPQGGSCDSTYEFDGANAYELRYLWWYGTWSLNSTQMLRQYALDSARYVQEMAFVVRPNLDIPQFAN